MCVFMMSVSSQKELKKTLCYGTIHNDESIRQYKYKPELQRTLSTFATFGLAFTNIGILSNTSATFQTVLQRGGPMMMLLSWNVVAIFMTCVALSLAEICSLYPTSGGLYYWVYELLSQHPKGKSKAPIIAFITGWTYYFANIITIGATNVTVALTMGTILELILDRTISKVGLMYITLGITLFHGFINVREMSILSFLNQCSVFWSCTGLLVIMITLSCWVTHRDALWVFTCYKNQTGFENPIYVLILGMVGAAYSLFGCECAASVNEETKDANISSSIAMISSVIVSWIIGFTFLMILLFSIEDIDSILNSKLNMPVTQLFMDAIGVWGAIGFLVLMLICQFCTGATTVTIASRQMYALARDEAAPLSSYLMTLNTYKLPGNAVWITVFMTYLVILPFPLSEHLFETIISAATITIHFSYAMVLGCRLIVQSPKKGKFNLGEWSTFITFIGFLWTVFAVFAFIIPTSWPMTNSNANYAGIGLITVITITILFWLGWGKCHYTGPKSMTDP
ncbi:amino acid transporter [Cokeromyces recurvatus]|uniref:amino acid transporter n=1 Tax=Cokeromyces recurvatus TaxID=90255 RepID=UPI0022201805|nr:amino acid transporter [Cokeromyces recurvatus]KAI7907454.1 amino acid transporter [Cokeromyces recurvatus]